MDIDSFKKRRQDIEEERRGKLNNLCRDYALSNSPLSVGDFATDHIGTIKVMDISWTYKPHTGDPECVYSGPCYTKSNKPFKSGEGRQVWQSNLLGN